MGDKTLSDLSEMMKKIDFCMLETHTDGDRIAARPMSTNKDVEYDGSSWFFTRDDTRMVADIRRDDRVGMAFQGSGGVLGLVGKPGAMLSVQGRARIIDDKSTFADHWNKDLEYWFEDGIDTPGMVMLRVDAERITWWDGMDQGSITI
ncbi:pyridoxamine 5'-phosphate oxidase family protein [Maribius pontilimi]|uniref:Pyridoxamine 5'-phosphate oxidase family protein n=1 Tax=Palleronia pontilimi TaxID=1964209 RepID=A0A934IHV0_9RHOB|nr:pyridoxamine 5'-phosphate oxidase family protein [Palleronia pontilimi]MBJ3763151.1 pyridoxamine 5'-phosphate oxidase family protein [Palleronia pontilimi]